MHTPRNKEHRDLTRATLFVLFLVLLLIITIFINPNNEDSKEKAYRAKVKNFIDGETLICSISPFKYSVNYQVSKGRGWSIERHSFTKGDMLISIDECQNSSITTKGESR